MARYTRWLRMVAFIASLAPLSAAAAPPMGMALSSSQPGRIGGITYSGGPVMTGRANVYLIWYGNITGLSGVQSIIEYFISNWGASHSYGVLRSYMGSNGRVAPELALAGSYPDPGSRGSHLAEADVQAVVVNAINNGGLPADANGIYLVIVGSGISATAGSSSLCTSGGFCGYHDHATLAGVDLKYGLVGSGNCTNYCGTYSSPNGTYYADTMVNTIAHEVAESVTDPDINAWGAGAANDEVGDKCNFNFTERYNIPPNSNGVQLPATSKVGMNYYSIQKLWTPTNGGGCYSGYSPPAAIVWQQGPGGEVSAWKMKDQNTVAEYLYYNIIPSGQNVIAVGDFLNDINPQVLTMDASGSGDVTLTELGADGITSTGTMFADMDLVGWKIAATGDVNGDGFSDIVFTNPSTGQSWLYLMQNLQTLSIVNLGTHLPWVPQALADFNGDGLADILWVDSPDQLYTTWLSAVTGTTQVSFAWWGIDATTSAATWGHPTSPILGAADFNGDSQADVLYYPVDWTGTAGVLFGDLVSTSPAEQENRFAANGVLPDSPAFAGVVDVNRDGTSDIYLQSSSGLRFYTMGDWRSNPPVYGPTPPGNGPTPAGAVYTDFSVTSSGTPLGDSGGWVVVGTGGFKEN